jgi:hypothetical protein
MHVKKFGLVMVVVSPGGTGYNQSAGWSSQVARWAHNPKVAGSNPAPATNPICLNKGEFLPLSPHRLILQNRRL